MAISQGLKLRQGQNLVMTPQLQQSIKLLQYSGAELAAYLENELEQNPLLEIEDGSIDGGDGGAAVGTVPQRGEKPSKASEQIGLGGFQSGESANFAESDGEERPLTPAYRDRTSSGSGGSEGGEDWRPEERLQQTISLRQHLVSQAELSFHDAAERLIALHLIDRLDDAGYLREDLSLVARQLACPPHQVKAILERLQQFDPTGVFATTLKECLALQLAERDRLDPAMALLLDHLPLLANGALSELGRLCSVDREDLSEMIQEVRALNPKPAEGFEAPPLTVVIPDLLLRPGSKGDWVLELNDAVFPPVQLNEAYHSALSTRLRRKAERDYLSERRQSASWLVRALAQRATTLLRVGREIVRQQDAFFRRGISHLRPLTLKEVAQAIEMHESTVSRATANKFLATPRGTYELKFFFTASLAGDDGALHAAQSIRHKIKAMIEAEAPNRVLSDQSIVAVLRRDGVQIARRTVAKYREAMRIPTSARRRKIKALSL